MDLDVVRRGFLKAANDYEYITMEGSGGILCPLCFDERKIQLEDVIREFELSSILVADAGLGTINSVVLTAEYMKAHSFQSKVLFLTITIPEILWKRIILLCANI